MPQDMQSFATCILKTDWRCFTSCVVDENIIISHVNKQKYTYICIVKKWWRESGRTGDTEKKTVLRYWFPSNRENWNMLVIWRLKSQTLLRSQTWSWIFFSRYPLFFIENEWVRPIKIISLCLLKANLLQILTIATK